MAPRRPAAVSKARRALEVFDMVQSSIPSPSRAWTASLARSRDQTQAPYVLLQVNVDGDPGRAIRRLPEALSAIGRLDALGRGS
jgi:hypothetical protein